MVFFSNKRDFAVGLPATRILQLVRTGKLYSKRYSLLFFFFAVRHTRVAVKRVNDSAAMGGLMQRVRYALRNNGFSSIKAIGGLLPQRHLLSAFTHL
jgi:hypothetical protein